MIIWVVAYLGGLLTILSPCILPVLPFVFSRSEKPFYQSGLPLLAGMAATFAAAATLAVAGGTWAIRANLWGRWVALFLLVLFAFSLIFPRLSELISRPLERLGDKLHRQQQLSSQTEKKEGVGRSFLLGVATGLLWAPCAGPILGLILTGAAVHGASVTTSVLLLAYALGAATSLGAALIAGGKLLGTLKKFLGAEFWIRKILGGAVLLGVLAIALGWDNSVLSKLSRLRTESVEETIVRWFHPTMPVNSVQAEESSDKGSLSSLSGAVAWINSPPLTPKELRGKVVLVDFWTYSCINCLRSLPYVKAWADKYKDQGLVVIGVHTPEFAFEKDLSNVEKAVIDLGVTYPVAVDSGYAIWNAFGNQYWPAHYFIDSSGKIRHHHFGEGDYAESERILQQLLSETHVKNIPSNVVQVEAKGAAAPSMTNALNSPETYIGYRRAENMVATPELKQDQEQNYSPPQKLNLNQWSLSGVWKIEGEKAVLSRAPGKLIFRFHARDLHLVLGPENINSPVHFTVRLDGLPPGTNHGTDDDLTGRGLIREQRLYQLIRQSDKKPIIDHTLEIEFSDPEVDAFAFTFS